jgi:hypothetical protein
MRIELRRCAKFFKVEKKLAVKLRFKQYLILKGPTIALRVQKELLKEDVYSIVEDKKVGSLFIMMYY